MKKSTEDAVESAVRIIGEERFDEILSSEIETAVRSAVADAFRWRGSAKEKLGAAVDGLLVSAIDSYDFTAHSAKLEDVLSDILEHSLLAEDRVMLLNFKGLMSEPPERSVTVEWLFEKFKRHVAENVDTYDLEVDTDDEPSYAPVSVSAVLSESGSSPWAATYARHAVLELVCKEDESIGFTVPLVRWRTDKEEGWEVEYRRGASVTDLRRLSSFEVLLMRLTRAGTRLVVDGTVLDDEVEPDAKPEATWS